MGSILVGSVLVISSVGSAVGGTGEKRDPRGAERRLKRRPGWVHKEHSCVAGATAAVLIHFHRGGTSVAARRLGSPCLAQSGPDFVQPSAISLRSLSPSARGASGVIIGFMCEKPSGMCNVRRRR